MTDLGTLTGGFSAAFGIDSKGQAVGNSESRPFLWAQGVMRDLGTLGGSYGEAYAISSKGRVAGWSETASGDMRATLWTRK
jgi:probable HAF family extracellular repeat protein